MNWLNKIVIVLVGGLFIFSGLIKLNDPVGTQIKLEEYFEVFAEDLKDKPDQVIINGEPQAIDPKDIKETTLSRFFMNMKPWALSLAVIMSALEVILGVNLLMGYRVGFTMWMLLLMIVFFTFLTYYSWAYDKVTDCGCFGDAIKLTPKESFMKDVVLTVLIGFLFFRKKTIVPPFSPKAGFAANLTASIAAFGLGFYAIYFLPPLDFRAYKIGNNIPALMKPAEELKYGKEKYVYTNLVTHADEDYEVWEEKLSDTLKYKYKSYEKPLLNPEALPKITDFKVWNEQSDFTEEAFKGNKLFIITEAVEKTNINSYKEIQTLVQNLKDSGIEVWLLSASGNEAVEWIRHEYQLAIPAYSADGKVLKTMIRSNPGIVLLKDGTVKGKWHYNKIPDMESLKQLL